MTVWPVAESIITARLVLEPLGAAHAAELAPVLGDARLHEFTGGRALTAVERRELCARLEAGHSPDGKQGWLNWVVRLRNSGEVVGTVQATLSRSLVDGLSATLAWVVALRHQGHGYAKEAAAGMTAWLGERGVSEFVAFVNPRHGASIAVARHLGMAATEVVVAGETRWAAELSGSELGG